LKFDPVDHDAPPYPQVAYGVLSSPAMNTKHPKRPRDPAQLAKLIVDIATGEVKEPQASLKSPMAELGRAGGLKGGGARANALDPSRRREIAIAAARKRWHPEEK
jgi:hypothetical protein